MGAVLQLKLLKIWLPRLTSTAACGLQVQIQLGISRRSAETKGNGLRTPSRESQECSRNLIGNMSSWLLMLLFKFLPILVLRFPTCGPRFVPLETVACSGTSGSSWMEGNQSQGLSQELQLPFNYQNPSFFVGSLLLLYRPS